MCRIIAILENALAKLSVLEKITPDEPEEGQQVCACVLVGVRSCGRACLCAAPELVRRRMCVLLQHSVR